MKALETMLEKCGTDALRVTFLREALDIAETETRYAVLEERMACVALAASYGRTWGENFDPNRSQIPGDEIANAIRTRPSP